MKRVAAVLERIHHIRVQGRIVLGYIVMKE